MALDTNKLVSASSSQDAYTPRLFTYKTSSDSKATVMAADYFANDPQRLKAGDVIFARCSDGSITLVVETATTTAATTRVLGRVAITGQLTDVSAASSAFVVSPIAGKIVKFYTCLQGAISVANSAVKLQLAGVDVTGGSVTVTASGSAAGDVDEATPTAANTVTAGQAIEVESDGGSSTTAALTFTIVIDPG